MDLLTADWVSFVKHDGTVEQASPSQIGSATIMDIIAPRPDFRGALYQFLIGLLQTTYAPQNIGEWRQRYDNPPSLEELKEVFSSYHSAFLL